MAAALLGGCEPIPWGSGAREPTEPAPEAFVVGIGEADLQAAAGRIATTLRSRWAEGLSIAPSALSETLSARWKDLTLTLSDLALTLDRRPGATGDLTTTLVWGAAETQATLLDLTGSELCSIYFSAKDLTLSFEVEFAIDAMGRWMPHLSPPARAGVGAARSLPIQADASGCVAQGTGLGDQLASVLERSLTDEATKALSELLVGALGLDLAAEWAQPVARDALGAGFVTGNLRASGASGGGHALEATAYGLAAHFALNVTVNPHPCMGTLRLGEANAGSLEAPSQPGVALGIATFERLVATGWLAGGACGDRWRSAAMREQDLKDLWPALAAEQGRVTLELWPDGIPSVRENPALSGALLFDFGRVRADLLGERFGARWRLGSVVVDLKVSGFARTDENGNVVLDLSDVDAVPRESVAGLLGAPPIATADSLVALVVDAVITSGAWAQGLRGLPPILRRPGTWVASGRTLVMQGE